MGSQVHRSEKELMKRANQLKYPTDRLGPTGLLTQVSHINSSRLIMVASQMGHAVSIENPERPLVMTGFENVIGRQSSMLDQVERDYEIVAKFVKNEYNYVLIGYNKKKRLYHAWKRIEVEEHSEGFATRYDNKFIDSLEVGDTVDKGQYIKKSTNFDKHMNYQFGKNVNVVYMALSYVHEDGILGMNGVEKMFNTYRSAVKRIRLADNEVLVNWYGDKDHYQGLPAIGEKTRKGFVGAIRRVDTASAPRSLKGDRLRHIERSDRLCYGEGRVIDIEILTNKDPRKMIKSGASKQINEIYENQQKYYRELYAYMRNIVDTADEDSHSYTDEFSIICEEAHDYVDAGAFYADNSDSVYGTTEIRVHLVDLESLMVGSKMVGRSGNKGVIAKILPPEQSWHMEDGTPIHLVVTPIGIVGRLNQSQLNEHSCNELGATVIRMMKQTDDLNQKCKLICKLLKHLNPEEGKDFKAWFKSLTHAEQARCCRRIERKGLTIIQEPIENADILVFSAAYEDFPANYQRVVFEDGSKSMRKVLCAKMFFLRLKQDPIEKFSSRSHGPVNPLNTLPAKSNLWKKSAISQSDVPVRFGEMEDEVLQTMCPHPYVIAEFMMENSTSYLSKYNMAEHAYLDGIFTSDALDDENEDVNPEALATEILSTMDLNFGKKNIEQIQALLGVLGTDIEIEYEYAKEGEWFDDYDLLGY